VSVRFLSLPAAVAELIPAGSTVGVGGMHMTSAPMAVVKELVRARVRVGRLVTSPSASIQADLLVGAGLVDEIMSPYVGFEHLGLAPSFRRAVESGQLTVKECDEGSLTHGLYAGAGGIPFLACPPGIESTDIPGVNPDFYRRTVDPFTGEERWTIPAIRPDVAVISCAVADSEGNVAFGRFPFTDRLMAFAARRLVVQVEEIVDSADLVDLTPAETIPAFLISALVVSPNGCHPTASPRYYERDEGYLATYLRAATDPDSLAEWIDTRIMNDGESS
jgi:glutaconate CoA-transferase subunit A